MKFGSFWFSTVALLAIILPASANSAKIANAILSHAQALNQQGSYQLEIGQVEAALEIWKRAEAAYSEAGDELGKLGSQLNQVQALQALGQYRYAKRLLGQINSRLQYLPDSQLKAKTLQSLGVALFRIGDLKESDEILQSSLQISQHLHLKDDTGRTLMTLGNVARSRNKHVKTIGINSSATSINGRDATSFYQQAIAQASNPVIRLESYLNLFSLLIETQETSQALSLLPQIQSLLTKLPPNRYTIYAQVNLAESLMQLGREKLEVAHLLADAIQHARSLSDSRAEAYALGELGHLYEQSQQWSDAERVTRQALQTSQLIQASDIAVSWQWQLGRILKQQGKISDAIVVYSQAVDTLSTLRGDLVAINPEAQFSFRERVEPIYRELVQLLLANNPTQENLKRARSVIEALQLAELNNFFREACLNTKPQQIDQVDPNAAVIYSIILPDRLAIILSIPNQPLQYHATLFTSNSRTAMGNQTDKIDQAFENLFATLNPFVISENPLRPHQQLYNWLIRPVEADLVKHQVKTLVFVMDGVLRGVPVAALHDGQQYLIEKYSLALSPGLQLLPPQPLRSDNLGTLVGGLSEARQGFSSLPGVEEEMKQIATVVPTSILLNQSFTQTQLAKKLDSVFSPIVHLATHGQFSSQAENTFLLTWDGRIKVKDLDSLVELRNRQNRQPIELLILSACQTAVGDKRAALGLAGVAIRSGARSTIASLWAVQDNSTVDLITRFYTALKQPGMTRAEALRQAQLSLLRSPEYQHPYYWAPFVLVGNWR